MFKKEKNKMEYFSGDKAAYQGAYFKPNSSALPFTVVALFAPDKPEIKKVKKDYVRFVLPKADKDMVKKGYITGALVTYRNADGAEKYIRAGVNKLGKEVKWSIPGVGNSGFTLRVKWICENEDGSVYESPASKPAGQGSVPKEKEPVAASANVEKEKKQQEGPKKKEEPAAQQDREEKLTEYQEVKEMPWKSGSLVIKEIFTTKERTENMRFFYFPTQIVWGTEREQAIQHNALSADTPPCEMQFSRTEEGYKLVCHQKLYPFSDNNRRLYYKDEEATLTMTIYFDDNLIPLKGTFQGSGQRQNRIVHYAKTLRNDGTIGQYGYYKDLWTPSLLTFSGSFTCSGHAGRHSYEDGNYWTGWVQQLDLKAIWKADPYTARKQVGEELEDMSLVKSSEDLTSRSCVSMYLCLQE